MKNIQEFALSLSIIIITLSGCFPSSPSITQAVLTSVSPSSTSEKPFSVAVTATELPGVIPPSAQYFPPLLTPRVTPFPTRTRAEASDDLSDMLKTNGDCELPCFWGIHLDQTIYEDLYAIIDKLGGSRFETLSENGRIRIASGFRFEDEHRIQVEFAADLENDIVRDLKILLLNLWKPENAKEDWSAYNMDEILRTYGVPDRIGLHYSGNNTALHVDIQLEYEDIDTYINYYTGTKDIDKYNTSEGVIYCPKEYGVNIVELHLGKHPFNMVSEGVSMLKGAGLSEQDFYTLITENPSACLTLKRDAFTP